MSKRKRELGERRPGRPATGQMPKVNFRLPADDLSRLESYAAEIGVRPSEYIRGLVLSGLRRHEHRKAERSHLSDGNQKGNA